MSDVPDRSPKTEFARGCYLGAGLVCVTFAVALGWTIPFVTTVLLGVGGVVLLALAAYLYWVPEK